MPFQKVEFEFPDPGKPEGAPAIVGEDDVEILIEGQQKEPEQKKAAEVEADLEVEIIDDEPPEDKGRKPMAEAPEEVTDEELEGYSKKVRKRLAHFSKGYHDKRREAEAAQRERQAAIDLAERLINENKKLKLAVSKNQEVMLEQAKHVTNSELEKAKTAYKTAYESGDADKLIEAQEFLTTAKMRSEQLASYKPPALQDEQSGVQSESNAPTQVADTRVLAWQQANPWFGPDDEMTSFALGVHTKLVKQGFDTKSEQYYEALDARMREVFPSKFKIDAVEDAPPKARSASVVAPVTRSTAPKKIVLSKSQVALAKRLGVPLQLYAEQVAEELRRQNG